MKRLAFVLSLLVALTLAPATPALNPLDDDAGSGADAGDSERYPTPVAPGLHRGRVSYPHDQHDWFTFPVLAGQEVALDVRDLQGAVKAGMRDGHDTWRSLDTRFKATRDGNVLIHVQNQDPVASRYAFTLTVRDPVPQDDGGSGGDADGDCANAVHVTSEAVTGRLDVYDPADCFHLPVRANETVTVRVDAAGTGIPVELTLTSALTRTAWLADGVAVSSRGADTVKLTAYLPREASADAAGAYRLLVTREGGDGDLPAPLPSLRTVPGAPSRVWSLDGLPDGRAVVTNGSGIWEVAATGARLIDARYDFVTHVTMDADGDLVVHDARSQTLRELRPGADVPFLATPGGVRGAAFGPGSAEGAHDGALYVADMVRGTVWDRFNHSRWYEDRRELLRVDADGAVAVVADDMPYLHQLAFSPDGTLYALEAGRGGLRIVDVETGAVEHVPSPDRCCMRFSGLAVDDAGRVYTVSSWDGAILRWDPHASTWGVVAWGARLAAEIAFAGNDLFVRTPGTLHEVRVVTLDAHGFGGFAGALHAPPVADLVVSDVREARPALADSPAGPVHPEAGESRTILVDVTNTGEGSFDGRVEVVLTHAYPEWMGRVGDALQNATLAPGETMTLAFAWDTTAQPGYHDIRVRMRGLDALESDPANNAYRHETGVVTECVAITMFGFGLTCMDEWFGWE